MKKRSDGLYKLTCQRNGVRKYFYGKTQTECRRKKQEYIDALENGTLPAYGKTITVREWMETWLFNVYPSIDDNTFKTYETITRVHIVPRFGDMPLRALQPMHIRDYITELSAKKSPHTVNHIFGIMRAAFNQAVNDDLLIKSPLRGVRTPKLKNVRPWIPLTEEQLRKFFSVIKDPTHRLIFMLAALTGLRRSELLGLRVRDIDLIRQTVSVNQKVIKSGNKLVITPDLKTKLSQRSMTITRDLLPLLKIHIENIIRRKHFDPKWYDYDLLFPSEHGRPYHPDWISRLAKIYAAQAGLPAAFCLNHLRHTNATLLLRNGADYKTVQARLGHSTAKLTLDTYSHILPGQDEDAAATLTGIIPLK